ncbi:MAG: hypothetical protein L0H93_09315 [Nocardioides sp.]|nr:hypothetical protein [Nocardioides sp.]
MKILLTGDSITVAGPFAEESSAVGAAALVRDGVHPPTQGHTPNLERWLQVFRRDPA